MQFSFVDGGVTAPAGFTASGILNHIKESRKTNDTALVFSEKKCAAAGVFTQNRVQAECVKLTKQHLSDGAAQAIIANSGNDIADAAAAVQALVPEADVAFAHGQMKESELERIMFDFINGEIDVLVSTTIVETGIDIPNANTIIIHDSDNMGLSQLYQLRGRVGRSNRNAYAFLMYRRDKVLREVAEKRLSAIREFTDLGSGFKIAMRDLEIRGAGNLLGKQQHGIWRRSATICTAGC